MTSRHTLFLAVVMLTLVSTRLHAQLQVSQLTCDFRTGLVVAEEEPLVGWQLTSSRPDARQTAYAIQLRRDDAPKNSLKTAKMESPVSQRIRLSECLRQPPLSMGQYRWRVRVWDEHGRASRWSSWQTFIVADEQSAFGNSKWIGAITRRDSHLPTGRYFTGDTLRKPQVKEAWAKADPLSRRSILLRRDILVAGKVRQAVMNVCGLGICEMKVNGKPVADDMLSPAWADYEKTVYYNTYDVTSLLAKGTNTLEALLGNGFYNEQGGRYRKLLVSFGPPTLRVCLTVTYADGSRQQFYTDPEWQWAESPVVFNSLYGGEDYDARLETPTRWHTVAIQEPPLGRMRPQQAYPVGINKYYGISRRVQADRPVYDMGQNLSGFPQVTVKGKPGQTIRLTVAEKLGPDSLCDQRQTGRPHYYEYTLRSDSTETWHPRFAYYGFKYIQVDGAVADGDPNPEGLPVFTDLKSCFLHNTAPQASRFECSNQRINTIHEIIHKAVRSNMQSIFTDCPHREKLGWLEQDYLNGEMLAYNYDLPGMLAQEIQNIADAQRDNGSVPTTAPEYVVFQGRWVDDFAESPEWGMAFVYLPFLYYERYGDDRHIRRHYEGMRRYVDYLYGRCCDDILDMGLGDWYDYVPGEKSGFAKNTPRTFVGTAHLMMMARYMASAAQMTDRHDDQQRYSTLAETLRRSLLRHFWNETDHRFTCNSQCANAMALVANICEDADREYVKKNLVDDIRARGNRLSTGDVGNRFLFLALTQENESDLLYAMLDHDEVPGYGYQIKWGATTLTEQWNPVQGSSLNHFMMGQVDEVFFRSLAGIRFVSADEVLISPQPMGDIRYVKATTPTIYGSLSVEWNAGDVPNVTAPIGLKVTIQP